MNFLELSSSSSLCAILPILLITPRTTGHTLQESLDELMQLQMLSPALALRVLIQFDKSINNALATRVKTKLHFKVLDDRCLIH